MTILETVLSFVGASLASGITWDLLKYSGEKIITNFKSDFLKEGIFDKDSDCEEFIEEIAKKQSISKKRPFNDIGSVYNEITDKSEEEFVKHFEKWIKQNYKLFEELVQQKSTQNVSVKIEHQENSGNGTIINAGIINHLGSRN